MRAQSNFHFNLLLCLLVKVELVAYLWAWISLELLSIDASMEDITISGITIEARNLSGTIEADASDQVLVLGHRSRSRAASCASRASTTTTSTTATITGHLADGVHSKSLVISETTDWLPWSGDSFL